MPGKFGLGVQTKRIPEKHLLLLYWLHQWLWLCSSQETEENSWDGNTRPPYLSTEKSVCRSRSNRTEHGMTDWLQIGKGARQGCTLSPCLFNFHAEYIMRNAGLDKARAGIKITRRNINNLRYADDTTLMAESEEERTKEPLDESERGEWKSWLKAQYS